VSSESLANGTRGLSGGFLRQVRVRSMRNGNWWRLSPTERAFYKSAISLAALRGQVVGRKLVKALERLLSRLSETPAGRIMKLGCARAEQMMQNFAEKGLTLWSTMLKSNLSNEDYIFCLGLDCINMIGAGVGWQS